MYKRGSSPVLYLVVFALLGIIGFLVYRDPEIRGKILSLITPTTTPVTEVTSTPTPTKYVSPYENTYSSPTLGIEFDYADYADAEKTIKISVSEQQNKVFVFMSNTQPSDGQFVEVFNKDINDSLQSAIEKKILVGISKNDCYVVASDDPKIPNYTRASISYPWPDQNEPKFMFGEKCPDAYKETNGIRYFVMDKNHPSIFAFVSIGQYGIPASSNVKSGDFVSWQDTLRFIK